MNKEVHTPYGVSANEIWVAVINALNNGCDVMIHKPKKFTKSELKKLKAQIGYES